MLATWLDPYFRVYVDVLARSVILKRSVRAFESLHELNAVLGRIEQVLRPLSAQGHTLLIDTRDAAAVRADLEPTLAAWGARFMAPFRACAILVLTTSGSFQAKRVRSQGGDTGVLVTTSVADAARHLGHPGLASHLARVEQECRRPSSS